jgi:hypothetical protein
MAAETDWDPASGTNQHHHMVLLLSKPQPACLAEFTQQQLLTPPEPCRWLPSVRLNLLPFPS